MWKFSSCRKLERHLVPQVMQCVILRSIKRCLTSVFKEEFFMRHGDVMRIMRLPICGRWCDDIFSVYVLIAQLDTLRSHIVGGRAITIWSITDFFNLSSWPQIKTHTVSDSHHYRFKKSFFLSEFLLQVNEWAKCSGEW